MTYITDPDSVLWSSTFRLVIGFWKIIFLSNLRPCWQQFFSTASSSSTKTSLVLENLRTHFDDLLFLFVFFKMKKKTVINFQRFTKYWNILWKISFEQYSQNFYILCYIILGDTVYIFKTFEHVTKPYTAKGKQYAIMLLKTPDMTWCRLLEYMRTAYYVIIICADDPDCHSCC